MAPPTSLGSSACLSEHGLHSWSCSVARLLHFPGLCPWSFAGHRHFRTGCLSTVGFASDRSLLSAIMHYAPGLDACLAEPCGRSSATRDPYLVTLWSHGEPPQHNHPEKHGNSINKPTDRLVGGRSAIRELRAELIFSKNLRRRVIRRHGQAAR